MRMDEQTKEIRQILLGRFQKEKDGSLSEVPAGSHWRMGGFQGLSAGWGAVHFLGIAHRKQACSLSSGMQKAQLDEAMKTFGRVVQLKKSPGISACLCQHWMTAPVLLTVAWEGADIDMSAYTTRGILSPFACRRALQMLERRLTGTTGAAIPRKKAEKRERRRGSSFSHKR